MPEWLPAVAVVAAIVAFFMYASSAGAKLEARKKALVAAARSGEATVLSTRQGSSAIRRGGIAAPEIILRLSLDGREVETSWHILPLGMSKIEEGKTVPVRIDANDPTIVYPAAEWAELSFTRWAEILKKAA